MRYCKLDLCYPLWGLIFVWVWACHAAPWICPKKIPAFDPSNSNRILGYFEANSPLEIGALNSKEKMYEVCFKGANGKEIRALCKASDLGLPEAPSPKIAEFAADPLLPPAYQSLLRLESDLWSLDATKFALHQSRFGFEWVSSIDRTASRSSKAFKFLGYPVVESIARFKNSSKDPSTQGKLEEITILLYGRGDSRLDLQEDAFMELLQKVESDVGEWFGVKGKEAPVKSADKDMKRKSWLKAPIRLDLDWSATHNAKESYMGGVVNVKFRAEYIRLTASPYDGKQGLEELTRAESFSTDRLGGVKQKDLKNRVIREKDGTVRLEGIPMVDQGEKGYCVVASIERVMRYYGKEMDQNELAKVTNTSEYGTSPEEMYKSMKRIGAGFGLNVRELSHFTVKDFLEEGRKYNQLAKRNKARQVEIPEQGIINVGAIYREMDPDVLREVYAKDVGEKNKFMKNITDTVDHGGPLLWSVLLGFVAETPKLPQSAGGHMRMIIGYNFKDPKKSYVFYTDSWGAGHEFKQMSLEDAFFITRGLYSVLPHS